ncbi:MAG: HupE/UreJ family protein [Myxococcota bacterium]
MLRRFPRSLMASLALVLFSSGIAFAHGRSVSYSTWEIDGPEATVSVRLKLLELSRIGPEALPPGSVSIAPAAGSPDLPARVFPTELRLLADGAPCPPADRAARRPDREGWVRYEWRVVCPSDAARLSIRSRLLLAVAPSHMHFARARFVGASEPLREQVLTEATPEFVLRSIGSEAAPAGSDLGRRIADYLVLGVEHILTGWDHLAFVFGLLLLAGRLGEVARLVTGFTLAHSLTLALAVMEVVHPRAAAVEAVIAFSVALVAIEKGWWLAGRPRAVPIAVLAGLAGVVIATANGAIALPLLTVGGLAVFTACYFALIARSSSEWLRICLTFAFGLVHGFGFAGILVEMTLPPDRLVPALLGFNLGVELGQIGVVLLLWPILWAGRRFAPEGALRWAAEVAAAALCGLGLFWFAERALGG